MPQICHAHCPGGTTGGLGLVAAALALAAGGAAISAFIGEIVLTAGIIVSVLLVAGTWYLVHILRRDQAHLTSRADAMRLAEPQRRPLAGPRPVISGAYVITDVKETPEPARIAIKRDGTVTG